jgi:hypothetical protein
MVRELTRVVGGLSTHAGFRTVAAS